MSLADHPDLIEPPEPRKPWRGPTLFQIAILCLIVLFTAIVLWTCLGFRDANAGIDNDLFTPRQSPTPMPLLDLLKPMQPPLAIRCDGIVFGMRMILNESGDNNQPFRAIADFLKSESMPFAVFWNDGTDIEPMGNTYFDFDRDGFVDRMATLDELRAQHERLDICDVIVRLPRKTKSV